MSKTSSYAIKKLLQPNHGHICNSKVLIEPPKKTVDGPLLFDEPKVYDSKASDPGCKIELSGELEAGEEYWQENMAFEDKRKI